MLEIPLPFSSFRFHQLPNSQTLSLKTSRTWDKNKLRSSGHSDSFYADPALLWTKASFPRGLRQGCVFTSVTKLCFSHWPWLNHWPIQLKQLLVTTAKYTPLYCVRIYPSGLDLSSLRLYAPQAIEKVRGTVQVCRMYRDNNLVKLLDLPTRTCAL